MSDIDTAAALHAERPIVTVEAQMEDVDVAWAMYADKAERALDAANKRIEELTEGLRELARVAESNSLRETPDEQVAEDFRLALEQVKNYGYNDDCLFCGFKDRVVMDALAKHPKEGRFKLLTGPVEIEQEDADVKPNREPSELWDALEYAWTIIANANGGSWYEATDDWSEAATRWRDEYHALLLKHPKGDTA